MIHIDTQRECEIKYNKLDKDIIETTNLDILNIHQTASENLIEETTPQSPSSQFLSSPCFNKRDQSQNFSQNQAQFYDKNFQSIIHQINNNTNIPCQNIQQDSNQEKQQLNPSNNYVKSQNILSPTPFKAINLTHSMLNNSTSHSLASSSSSSSQASSYSNISASSQKKELQTNQTYDWQIKSFSSKKILLLNKNLYQSDEEQDYCDQEENIIQQSKFHNKNILSLSKIKNMHRKGNQQNKNIHQNHCFHENTQYTHCQFYQEDDYDEMQNSCNCRNEYEIKTKSFLPNQITHFILEDNNNKSNSVNNNTPAANNINTNLCNNSSGYCCNNLSHISVSNCSQSTPHQFISSNEIDSDELMSLANSIERTQNPQSKDKEFLLLNSSSFTEDTFEQFKEFLLSEHLDKSF